MENVNYDPRPATRARSDAGNTAQLVGKTYAQVSNESLALFSFGEQGSFTEICQRVRDGRRIATENQGNWMVDSEGVIQVTIRLDHAREITTEQGTAMVTGGLGALEMSLETQGEAEASRALNLIQVEAFVEEEVIGSWFELGENGLAGTGLTFNADGTGAFEDQFGKGLFDWRMDDEGRLRVFSEALHDGSEGTQTVTFYKLANSEGEMLSVVMVFRRGSELDYDIQVDPGDHLSRNAIETFMLFKAF